MKEDENGEKIYKKFKDAEIENSKNSFMSKSKISTFGLDENGVIKTFYRTPFVQEEIFYICSIDDYGKKQETPYYVLPVFLMIWRERFIKCLKKNN